jgi:hypothetical protein
MRKADVLEDRCDEAVRRVIVSWLQAKGWTVGDVSPHRIQGPVDNAGNWELVFRFTGKEPRTKKARIAAGLVSKKKKRS